MTEIVTVLSGDLVRVDPCSSGFAHGFGVFETILCREGKLYFWDAHWQRLLRSGERLSLDCAIDPEQVLASIKKVVESFTGSVCAVKLSLLRGVEEDQLFVYARAIGELPESVCLGVMRDSPINERSVFVGIKTHNYAENMYLLNRSRCDGYADSVRLNTLGHVAETMISNIFFFTDGILHTPNLSSGALPGVARAAVIEAAELTAIESVEGEYSIDSLRTADVLFLTNSLTGLLEVDRMEELVFSTTSDTLNLFEQLRRNYLQLAEKSCINFVN